MFDARHMQAKKEERSNMDHEARRTAALEEIADTLMAIHSELVGIRTSAAAQARGAAAGRM